MGKDNDDLREEGIEVTDSSALKKVDDELDVPIVEDAAGEDDELGAKEPDLPWDETEKTL